MSEKEYVSKVLNYIENAFKYLVGVLSSVVVFLVFNYDGTMIQNLAIGVGVFCVVGLVYCAYL
ncbi:MAG: hypothetical protein ACI4M9_03610, partial [Succinivibrio sp.]